MALYTLGYAARGSELELARLMADPKTLLVDIRLVPASRWCPQWRKAVLSATYGERYLHLVGLGNLNYKDRDKGIQLLAPDAALLELHRLQASGWSLVLLCACADYAVCHRRTVYELLVSQEEKEDV